MNITRVNQAIAIMERAKKRGSFFIGFYQSDKNCKWTEGDTAASTEAELRTRRRKASFAGHVAVSPEFQLDGGKCFLRNGAPSFNALLGSRALAAWLEIDKEITYCFVNSSYFYKKSVSEITVQDVIDKLVMLRDHGEDAMLEYIKTI